MKYNDFGVRAHFFDPRQVLFYNLLKKGLFYARELEIIVRRDGREMLSEDCHD